jgi:elongation factor Ts
VGVLLALSTESEAGANHEETRTLAKDLCMQVAATAPVCVNRGDMSEEIVAKEREIATAQAEGKPPQAVEKIIAGKLDKFYATSCLDEQSFVKNPDQTIQDLLAEKSKVVGEALSIAQFTRLQIGETG